jgi:hypothetical protein
MCGITKAGSDCSVSTTHFRQRHVGTAKALWLLQLGLGQLSNTSCELRLQAGHRQEGQQMRLDMRVGTVEALWLLQLGQLSNASRKLGLQDGSVKQRKEAADYRTNLRAQLQLEDTGFSSLALASSATPDANSDCRQSTGRKGSR